jgi:phosphatidylglycerophosphatase A
VKKKWGYMHENRPDGPTVSEAFKEADLSGRTALILSSWFGSGLGPLAPGTFGSLAALPLVIILNCLGPLWEIISLIIIIPLALWASGISQVLLKKNDPAEVVIDEVAGMVLAVFLLPVSWWTFIPGFLLFRLFDILKPFPIGIIDRKMSGGAGIVLDDLVAGVYANICVRIILAFLG